MNSKLYLKSYFMVTVSSMVNLSLNHYNFRCFSLTLSLSLSIYILLFFSNLDSLTRNLLGL